MTELPISPQKTLEASRNSAAERSNGVTETTWDSAATSRPAEVGEGEIWRASRRDVVRYAG